MCSPDRDGSMNRRHRFCRLPQKYRRNCRLSPLPALDCFFRDTVVFRMTCGNSVNKGANIHSVVKTVDIKNMPLNMIKKSVNIRVVQPCRFPNRQTSQEWSIYLFRPSQYAPKYRDSPAKKYPKRSRYLLILQSRVPP